jgi:hypothetical protein
MSGDPVSTAREAALAEVFGQADALTRRLEAIALIVSKNEGAGVTSALADFKASLSDGILKSNERLLNAIHEAQALRTEPVGHITKNNDAFAEAQEAVAEMRNLAQIIKGTTEAFSEGAKDLGGQMHRTQTAVDDSIKALATFKPAPGVKQALMTASPPIKAVPYKNRANIWRVAAVSCAVTALAAFGIHSFAFNTKHAALGSALSKGWNELDKNTRADLNKVLKDQSLAR